MAEPQILIDDERNVTGPTFLAVLPAKSERHKVVDTLRIASEQGFDEVVILGFKDGKSYLNHSRIDDTPRLVGAN